MKYVWNFHIIDLRAKNGSDSMYEVKTEIKIIPDGYEAMNHYFHQYVLKNYIELGAKLIGRWVDEDYTLITEIWGFQDKAHYNNFFNLRKKTSHYKNSLPEKIANDKWIISKKETHMMPTGHYFQPMHHVSACVYVENEKGEVLLVRSLHRSDTLELPGGALDKEESIVDCAIREVKEETGLDIEVKGLVYHSQNISNGVICFVFHGIVTGGNLKAEEDETTDVGFYNIEGANIHKLVTREQFVERIQAASQLNYIPFDIVQLRPYQRIHDFS